jgi:pimeloyl-ACP methyl ester carboxylesterase
MDLIRAIFPQARMTTIAKAGHWVHADAPAEFFQVVIDFLQHDGPSPGP